MSDNAKKTWGVCVADGHELLTSSGAPIATCVGPASAEALARATEVVNAIGTDDVAEAVAIKMHADLELASRDLAHYEKVNKAMAVVAALGTDDVEDVKAIKHCANTYDDIIHILGTSDLDEMRRMRKCIDLFRLAEGHGYAHSMGKDCAGCVLDDFARVFDGEPIQGSVAHDVLMPAEEDTSDE